MLQPGWLGRVIVNVVLQLWDSLPLRALVNMHLRFDGRLGFPGGLIDKVTQIIICHVPQRFFLRERI